MQACQRADARIWIDLEAPEPAELAQWLDKLQVTGLSRRLCLESGDRSGFYPLKRELLLVTPVLTSTEEPGDVDYIAFLCRGNLLLTRAPHAFFEPAAAGRVGRGRHLASRTQYRRARLGDGDRALAGVSAPYTGSEMPSPHSKTAWIETPRPSKRMSFWTCAQSCWRFNRWSTTSFPRPKP